MKIDQAIHKGKAVLKLIFDYDAAVVAPVKGIGIGG